VAVEELTLELDIGPVHVRRAGGDETPPLFLHDILVGSATLVPFLERSGGLAPDLIGFGASSKAGNLDFSLSGHADFIERLLDELAIDSVRLVASGWGAGGGLVFAQRHPERVHRLVLMNPLPLFPGFAWDRRGRLLQRPALGEIAIGAVTRRYLARLMRGGAASDAAWSDDDLAAVWEIFDQGTQRAILRMFRDATPDRLAAAGAGLGALEMPALVVWGERDPWFATGFSDAYVARLGDARGHRLPDAGHWPWRDDPTVIDRVAEFLVG